MASFWNYYEATDSRGGVYLLKTRANREVTHALIATWPSKPATTFSSAVEGGREATAITLATAEKTARHLRKNFGAFDFELVEVVSVPAPAENPSSKKAKRPDHGLNLDEMEKRSAVFAKLLAAYFKKHGARYRIDYGLQPAGNVHDVFGDGYYVRLDGAWLLIVAYEGEVPDLTAKAEKAMLRKAKLDKFLYYDGWESCGIVKGGGCAPGTWRRWFWEEKDRTGRQHDRVYGRKPIETYVFRPRIGATDVNLKPTKRTKRMERKLANPRAAAKPTKRKKISVNELVRRALK